MDIQKKKQMQEKIYKMPQSVLKKVVDTILKSNSNIKYTKTLNGYFFNMSLIDDETLLKINDILVNEEKKES